MKVYDFILGKSLSTGYMTARYTKRFSREDSINTNLELLDILIDNLRNAFKTMSDIPTNVDVIIASFTSLKGKLTKSGGVTNKSLDDADNPINIIRELLADLAFIGYQVYLIERVDLDIDKDMEPVTRAYMIDENSNLFHNLNRVSQGYGIVFDIPQQAALPNVIMQFLTSILNFSDVTKSIIDLEVEQNRYEALQSANTGYLFDISRLQKFLEDYGYRFIVVLN